MRDRVDHAADRGGILELTGAVHLVQPQALERGTLDGRTADRAADLLDDDGCHAQASAVSAAGAAAGLSCCGRMSATFLPRRLATERGEASALSPSMVARITL